MGEGAPLEGPEWGEARSLLSDLSEEPGACPSSSTTSLPGALHRHRGCSFFICKMGTSPKNGLVSTQGGCGDSVR